MIDHDTLTGLNKAYIDSVQNCDVKRFEELLSDDYYCSNPDGSLVDRAGFLAQTAKPVTIRGLRGENVMIRMLGDVAIIHGATAYTTAAGRAAHGRYTDTWRKENGTWRTIAAHDRGACDAGVASAGARPAREQTQEKRAAGGGVAARRLIASSSRDMPRHLAALS